MAEKREAGVVRAWLKEHKASVLKVSAVLFAGCWALTYWSASSGSPVFMGVTVALLSVACLLPAVL